MPTDREQKLVDIMFQVALIDKPEGWDREKRAAWIADQLRACGFPTRPAGSSWGVLTADHPDD